MGKGWQGGRGEGGAPGVIIKPLEFRIFNIVSVLSLLKAESPSKARALTLDSLTDLCESRFESVNLCAIKEVCVSMYVCVCVCLYIGILEYMYVEVVYQTSLDYAKCDSATFARARSLLKERERKTE